ncbi:MAG: thiamine phosphate synthase, partial [Bacteroidaceae bacterium]|nr:thiamine phosphate synthase [Bacteroidaceae bacterium]
MLQFITHTTERYGYVEGAIEALNGGCKWIQLRMKGADADDIRRAVDKLKPLC